MPCRDDYPVAPEHTYKGLKAILEPLLCEACDLLESQDLLKKASPELKAWAKKHEESEKARVKLEAEAKLAEKTKKEALAKLSPKERRALGLEK